MHIIQNLGRTHGITADKLEEAGKDAQRHIKPQARLEILDEIYRVKRLEERYERGEIDPDTLTYVNDYTASSKARKDAKARMKSRDYDQGAQSPGSDSSSDVPVSESNDSCRPSKMPIEPERPRKFMRLTDATIPENRNPSKFSGPRASDYNQYKGGIKDPTGTRNDITRINPPEFTTSPMESDAQIGLHPPIQAQHSPSEYNPFPFQPVLSSVNYPNMAIDRFMSGSSPYSHITPNHQPELLTLPELDTMTIPAFRTGSLSHPHFLPHNQNGELPTPK